MAKINYEKMSVAELEEMRSEIDVAITDAKQRERAALRQKFEDMALEAGLSIADVVGSRSSKGRKVAAKYRNPDDASETWTGRGRRPSWLAAKLAKGGNIERFLIK